MYQKTEDQRRNISALCTNVRKPKTKSGYSPEVVCHWCKVIIKQKALRIPAAHKSA